MAPTGSLAMNTVPTAKIAYNALRQRNLKFDAADFAGPLMARDMLTARLPRSPRVFVMIPTLPVGDEAPLMRLQHLSGQYVMLRITPHEDFWEPSANPAARSSMGGHLIENEDQEQWARKFRDSSPDVVLTSQIFFIPKDVDKSDIRVRAAELLAELRKKRSVPVCLCVIPEAWKNRRMTRLGSIESKPLYAGCIDQMNAWRDSIQSGTTSIEAFRAWYGEPKVDASEVAKYQEWYSHKYGAGLLAIQYYPAELKTTAEMERSVGIV